MTLFNRLLLIIFGTGLIPIIPTAGFLFYYQSAAKSNVQNLHENIARMAALMVSQKADELDRRLYNMWEPGIDYVTEPSLRKTLARNPEFLFMAFTGPGGRELLSGGAPEIKRLFGFVNLSNDPLFKKAARTGRSQLGEFELIYNLPICRLVYPMESGHYAFAVINLRDLFVKLEMQKMGSTGGVFISGPEGRVFSLRGETQPVSRESLKGLFAGPAKSARGLAGAGGNSYLASYSEVPGFELYALTLQERRDAFKGINLITSLIAFFLLGISTVFYFSALILSRRLINPVSGLIEGARRVANHNFKQPVNEDADITEMASLLRSFNAMMTEVDRYHGLQVDKMLEEKQKVELLISLIHDAIILCDFRGALLYANASARELLGFQEGAKQGPEPKVIRRRVFGLINLKAKTEGEIIELADPPGQNKYYRMSMQVLSSKTGTPGVFMVLRDVTLEQEMQRVKEDFFHAVAHDLRAPLLAMQGYIKLLEQTCAPAGKTAGYLANIKDSSARLFEMLENILDIARMEAGNLKPLVAAVDAEKFVSAAFEGFKALFEEKKIDFRLDPPAAGVPAFRGDERLLRRVLENILSNAYKFTPSGGTVVMGVRSAAGRVSFYISDTGPGIPEGQREAVFEKYKQLKGAQGEQQGFGLGLAITKKIVEMHKGRIYAEAGPSGGSRFVFELPE
ncbi:MAG: ATP-binding protein [Elusimicrobiales bacterium]|jgi:signal transduction histidine kinase